VLPLPKRESQGEGERDSQEFKVLDSRVVGCPFRSFQLWPIGHRLAFTLIELMLAISIAAIVMAIGLPGWIKALKKEGLRKAVSDVVEGCSQARAQAILKGVPMEFVLRAEDGSISVQAARLSRGEAVGSGQSGEGSGSAGEFAGSFSGQLPNDVGVKLIYVNFQDKMELPEARVRFFPNGTCDEFTVILFSPSGEKKISADLITGLTEVDTIR